MKTLNQTIILLLLCWASVMARAVEDSNEVTIALDALINDEVILHTNQREQNLLHLAVLAEDMTAVRYLANKAPSLIQGRDEDGDTPFLYSCISGNMEVAEFLLSKEGFVDINESNNNEFTCLHFLAVGLHLTHIPVMVEKGADPTLPDLDGDLPVHMLLIGLQMGEINSFMDTTEVEAALGVLNN